VALDRVLAPPYDVIDEAERAALLARDPHNVVRLILPEGGPEERYRNAAGLLAGWRATGVLHRDERPCLYRYCQEFAVAELGGQRVTRRGLIAAVRLHDFAERIIRPHERTLRGPKLDRLALMRATRSHLSQIFTLYPDPDGELDALLAAVETRPPELAGTTGDGTRHLLWRVADPALIARVVGFLAPRVLYIADGHHRYETMLALRDELAAQHGPLAPRSAAGFGTLFLASMDDPGLVVLPTHRLVHGLPDERLADLRQRLSTCFELCELSGAAARPAQLRAALGGVAADRPGFVALFAGGARAWLCTLRRDVDLDRELADQPAAVRALDVTVLHTLVLDRLLGIDGAAQEAGGHLRYEKSLSALLAALARGAAQVGFAMRPTRIDQVRAVADAGAIMPQKSTFFFPKLASGLVLHTIDPAELL
jgi:uncharacterized protein (DUF1015 family)